MARNITAALPNCLILIWSPAGSRGFDDGVVVRGASLDMVGLRNARRHVGLRHDKDVPVVRADRDGRSIGGAAADRA